MSKKFKVGDRVRVTGDCHVGEVGVISRVKGDKFDSECTLHNWDYEVKFDKQLEYTHRGNRGTGSMVYYYYNEHNLELVSTGTKYKPGDMVTVRDDLDRWSIYHMADKSNPMAMTDQMLGKRGKKVKIKSVTKTGKYMIEGSIFPWVDEMFEDKVETSPNSDKSYRFKVGDTVRHQIHSDYGVGTVYAVKPGMWDYDVIWSNLTYGHDGEANDGSNNHWYVNECNLESSLRFNVGDKVRVREDLERKSYYMRDGKTRDSVTPGMMGMKGKVVTITRITVDGKYRIEGSGYNWTDEMFEPDVVKSEKREPKVGDRIRMTEDWCSAKKGMVGTIIYICPLDTIDVRFDKEFPGGHSCHGKCESGFGQNVLARHFEIIDEATSYLICSVKFTENGKLYCYLTDDTTITVGSDVKVPVGKNNHEKTATVERIGRYFEFDAPYGVSEMKKVIGKANSTFDWEEFKKTKIIVKLDTKEKYDAFMKECDEHDVKWRFGGKASELNMWDEETENFSVVHGIYGAKGLGYARLKFHTKELPDAVVYDYKLPESKPEVKLEPKPESEMKRKFKVGDRVKVVKSNYLTPDDKGHEGTVVKVKSVGYHYTIDFGKEYYWTHDGGMCDGKRSYRHYDENYLEAVKEKPKYYNGKVVCTENKIDDKDFTVGKIYEVIDGKIVDNKTDTRPVTKYRLSSDFDHLDEYFEDWHYTFRPVERVTKETKLKCGDRIVMRDDLAVDRWYGLTWYSDMEHDMSGEIVTVTEGTDYQGDCRVKAPKSGRNWYVTTEMIAYKIID